MNFPGMSYKFTKYFQLFGSFLFLSKSYDKMFCGRLASFLVRIGSTPTPHLTFEQKKFENILEFDKVIERSTVSDLFNTIWWQWKKCHINVIITVTQELFSFCETKQNNFKLENNLNNFVKRADHELNGTIMDAIFNRMAVYA